MLGWALTWALRSWAGGIAVSVLANLLPAWERARVEAEDDAANAQLCRTALFRGVMRQSCQTAIERDAQWFGFRYASLVARDAPWLGPLSAEMLAPASSAWWGPLAVLLVFMPLGLQLAQTMQRVKWRRARYTPSVHTCRM